MQVKIISQFNCQSFPLDETAIEITEEELAQIGKTKCFDVKRNRIIDYDGSKELEKENAIARIEELKRLLSESDYRAIKYAEGEYTEEEYKPYRVQRKAYRVEINELQEKYNLN